MSIVISGSLVLADVVSGGGIINANNPLIGWRNLAALSPISATSSATGFPVSNLANPATHLRWKAADNPPVTDQYVRIDVNSVEALDYLAIARHNFAGAQIPVSIEGLVSAPNNWVELAAAIPPSDGPVLFRFAPRSLISIRVRMQPGLAAPTMAVVYTGKLLVLQRRIYVGHTPINYGRRAKITNARSESGNFLGRIVLNEQTETSVDLQNLTPDWYRAQMEPFIRASKETPFFFAWRPGDYPYEVGYCWMTNDPQPSNQRPNGMMQINLEMTGIA